MILHISSYFANSIANNDWFVFYDYYKYRLVMKQIYDIKELQPNNRGLYAIK